MKKYKIIIIKGEKEVTNKYVYCCNTDYTLILNNNYGNKNEFNTLKLQ